MLQKRRRVVYVIEKPIPIARCHLNLKQVADIGGYSDKIGVYDLEQQIFPKEIDCERIHRVEIHHKVK